MLYQGIIVAGLLIFMLNLTLNLRNLKTLRRDEKIPEPAPFISVLVPARDEEANIAACLDSLQKQDYPNYEIVVLDDNSSDNTGAIVADIAGSDSRVRPLRGEPLPEGWTGKSFACYQLAKQACGSWLLFVDADTTHAPHVLRSALAQALRLNSSLLSGFPRQLANSLPQKMAMPVLYFIILTWFPLWWLQRAKEPKPSLAIGQFLLLPREEYWRIGGHEAVKSRILEDVWLGVEISRRGGRQVAVDLSPAVSCNMYHNMGTMMEGFIKWVYSVASLSPIVLTLMMSAAYFFYLAPFYHLWRELFVVMGPIGLRAVVISQVGVILFMRWLVDSRFKAPFISAFLHPLGLSFLFLAAFCAVFRRAVGAGVRWKERLYSRGSSVE
jgi:chlorobactene glucosyltransferase